MTNTTRDLADQGTWVEIESTVLAPAERAAGIPEDTAATPLMLWINGFATHPARVGEHVTVRTLIGRTHTGTLRTINPGYTHSFGDTVGELLTIGTEYEA